MWTWIKKLFGLKDLCKITERANLIDCRNHGDSKIIKKQINRFIKAREVK